MPLDLDKIRAIMTDRRLSQTDMARRSGIAQPNVAALLGGRKTNVKVETLDKLAKALGVKAGELLR